MSPQQPKAKPKMIPVPLVDKVHVEQADIVQAYGEVTAIIPSPEAILSDVDQANLKRWIALGTLLVLGTSQIVQLFA